MGIPFNIPPYVGTEMKYVGQAVAENRKISGDGPFTKRCNAWIEEKFGIAKTLLTTSGTHALEMCAFLMDLKPGDEVIMPSFTFSSSANAFLVRGAVPVFIDIRPDTMNMDENLIEAAITERTKGICVVHYAGVACEMDKIMAIAREHGIFVIEDAAQGVMSLYKDQYLGTIGDMGAYSFHETKNYSMGEGGALLLRDERFMLAAEILREKGTNRSSFYRGEIDKYTWLDKGSSYLPSDINAAYLYAQLESAQEIFDSRMAAWNRYDRQLASLAHKGCIELPFIPENCKHNAHMYYIKCRDTAERSALLKYLSAQGIYSAIHYVPLHSATAGLRYTRFNGEDKYTTDCSSRLTRLPMFYGVTDVQVDAVCEALNEFYRRSSKSKGL